MLFCRCRKHIIDQIITAFFYFRLVSFLQITWNKGDRKISFRNGLSDIGLNLRDTYLNCASLQCHDILLQSYFGATVIQFYTSFVFLAVCDLFLLDFSYLLDKFFRWFFVHRQM